LDYQFISKEIQSFSSVVQNIFRGSLGALDGDLSNVVLLRDDEINFIRRKELGIKAHMDAIDHLRATILPFVML
jgi:hypothetical protein